MEHLEGSARAVVVVGSKKVSLGGQADIFHADLLSPADEIGEIEIKRQALFARVLVGFGREEAHVVDIGSEGRR